MAILIWASFQLGVGFLGFAANILQIVLIRRKGEWRSVFTLTLLSLCIADLIASLMMMWLGCSGLLVDEKITAPELFKTFFIIGITFSSYTSGCHILFIAVQRLCAVIYPLRFKRVLTLQRCKVVLACIWLVAAGYTYILIFLFEKGYDNTSAYNMIFGGMILILLYTVLCYKMIRRSNDQSNICIQNLNRRLNWRIIAHSFAVMIIFVLCSLLLASAILVQSTPGNVGFDIAFLFFALHPLLDSLLYFFTSYRSCWRNNQTSWFRKRTAVIRIDNVPVAAVTGTVEAETRQL